MSTQLHQASLRRAYFRFYEELNDFLAEERRKQTFCYQFKGNPSIKDTIEAIGIPHPDIDLIIVNGESVDFNYQMQGGERVAVYPVFESFDISPLNDLRAKPLRDSRFILDVHLGTLAKKLRLLGFDCAFKNNYEDHQIVDIANQEKRIILTRDRGILKYNAVTHGYWVRCHRPDEQLREVMRRFQLEKQVKPLSRCASCNGPLHSVDKATLSDRLAAETLHIFNHFMECGDCHKLYWQGSHYDKICRWLDELNLPARLS